MLKSIMSAPTEIPSALIGSFLVRCAANGALIAPPMTRGTTTLQSIFGSIRKNVTAMVEVMKKLDMHTEPMAFLG